MGVRQIHPAIKIVVSFALMIGILLLSGCSGSTADANTQPKDQGKVNKLFKDKPAAGKAGQASGNQTSAPQ